MGGQAVHILQVRRSRVESFHHPKFIICCDVDQQSPSAYDSTKHGRVHEVMTDTSDATTLLSDEQFHFAFSHEAGLVCPVQILAWLEQAEILKGSARVYYDEMIRYSCVTVALEVIRTIAERDIEAQV